MTLDEIKQAVDAGQSVHWTNIGYVVTKDPLGQNLICFTQNESAIGLTNKAGTRLNGRPHEFFIAQEGIV